MPCCRRPWRRWPALRPTAVVAQDAASRPARTRGPAVWLDLDQAELDDAYDQSKYAPNLQQIVRRYALNSERARQRLGPPRRVTYGTSAIEALDIYATTRANAPIQVFLHGGAWRFGLARDYAFAAELFVKAGAHFVVPDFTWVQDADGNLMTMAEQVRRAIVWVHRNAASFGSDPDASLCRVLVRRPSRGGRAHDRLAQHLRPAARSAQGRPVLQRSLRPQGRAPVGPQQLCEVHRRDRSGAERLSPCPTAQRAARRRVRRSRNAGVPASRPRVRRRGARAGKPVQLIVAEAYNHFEVIERSRTLTDCSGAPRSSRWVSRPAERSHARRLLVDCAGCRGDAAATTRPQQDHRRLQ